MAGKGSAHIASASMTTSSKELCWMSAHDEKLGAVGEDDAVADVVRVHQEQEDDGFEHHLGSRQGLCISST